MIGAKIISRVRSVQLSTLTAGLAEVRFVRMAQPLTWTAPHPCQTLQVHRLL